MPILYRQPGYISGGDPGTNFTGPWIRTTGFDAVTFHVFWSASGNSSGSLSVDGSNDESGGGTLTIASSAAPAGVGIDTSAAGATTMSVSSGSVVLPEFVRLRYSYTSGTGGSLTVHAIGR